MPTCATPSCTAWATALRPGSYFFHCDCDSKPGKREEAKARAFISDIVEDYFMTYNGQRNPCVSEIVSLS